MQRVNVYFDGFNFYNGLKASSWEKYYWLDVVKFSNEIIATLNGNPTLIKAYYFSAPPYNHETKKGRQAKFFKANSINSSFNLILGYHKDKSKSCNKCGEKITMSEEKQTDVNIALYMLGDAVKKYCDLSILISGDTDMIPIIEAIKKVNPSHQVMVFFPPLRKTNVMIGHVDGWRDLSSKKFESIFANCILPDKIEWHDSIGNITDSVEIPGKWKNFK